MGARARGEFANLGAFDASNARDVHHDGMHPVGADLDIGTDARKRATSNVLRGGDHQRRLPDLAHVRHHHRRRDALRVNTAAGILAVQRLGEKVGKRLGG
mgnify:CR=1 FL=1